MLESPFIVKCTFCDEELEAKFDNNGLFDLDDIEDHIESHEDDNNDDDDEQEDSDYDIESKRITFKSEFFL